MKKILLIIAIALCIFQSIILATTYTSQYPPAQSDDYVKATTWLIVLALPHFATDPTLLLTGGYEGHEWLAANYDVTDQRFHIDLGSAKIIRRIYYENSHHNGTAYLRGVKNFTFWGSNTGEGTFDDLVWENDEGWTQLTTSQVTFDIHIASNEADPKYITVTNTTAYRYYAFKFADNYGNVGNLGVRRIDLQTEDEEEGEAVNAIFFGTNF